MAREFRSEFKFGRGGPDLPDAEEHRTPPRMPFGEWLATPYAPPEVIDTFGELLEWIASVWDDDLLQPLSDAVEQRSQNERHVYIAILVTERPLDHAWEIGQTAALGRDFPGTVIMFRPTDAYIQG